MPDLEVRPAPGEDVVVIAPTGAKIGKVSYNSTRTRARVKNTAAATATPTPTPEPTPAPTNPSGIAMPTTEPAGWRRIFADDFLTPAAEGEFLTKYPDWAAYPYPWPDTSKNTARPVELRGYYDPSIISVHDSLMDKHLRQKDGKWRVAAPYPKVARGTSLRISVCFKADAIAGFKTAWLTWPLSETWPRDGEIDFPEGALTGYIEAYMHRQGAAAGSDQDHRGTTARYTSWHVATIEWVAGQSCAFYLDGTLLGPVITSRVPSTAMRYVVQTETLISATPPPSGAQGHVYLDWITVAVKA